MAQSGFAAIDPTQDGKTVSILLVDDDTLSNQVVSRRLMQEGYSVTTAAGGREALHTLDRQRFDLILLDLAMPDMDGIETLKRIRSHPLAALTPVIMLSAHDDSASVKTCLANGAIDYLSKPLVMSLVRNRIERCLDPGKLLSRETRKDHAEQAAPMATAADRVLIVDDDVLNCRLLARQLERPGLETVLVTNGQAALDLLRRERFGVVLLDVNMPGMSGTELLKHIRSNEQTRQLPVIVVTGTNDVAVMLECIDHGADGYLSKPVDIGHLRSCILSALESDKSGPEMTISLD